MSRCNCKTVLIVCVAMLIGGWWLAASPNSPISPKNDRPVLRLVARLAKLGLWMMFVAEKPQEPDQDKMRVVHAGIDEDGHRLLDHGSGW